MVSPIRDLAMDIIYRTSTEQLNTIKINTIMVPVPPISVEARQYCSWFDEYFARWLQNNPKCELISDKVEWIREKHLQR